MNNSYKIGEFAQICGTAKSTLIYYAKIGLLKPDHIGENGYFYYSPSQIYMYEVIASLRNMDVSLEDIRDYLKNQDIEHCMGILKKNLEKLRERKRQLERIETLMEATISDTQKALKVECDKFEIVSLESEHYFVYRMPYRTEKATYDLKEARKLIDYCKRNFYNGTLNVSEIVMQEDIENGSFKKTYGAFKLRDWQVSKKKLESNVLFTRPKGIYATVARRSGGEKIPGIYRDLCGFAKSMGYHVCGNGYEEDLLSYMAEHDRSNYLLRCYIQIAPDET